MLCFDFRWWGSAFLLRCLWPGFLPLVWSIRKQNTPSTLHSPGLDPFGRLATWHPFKADLSVFILWDEEGLVLILVYKTDSCSDPCLPEECPYKIWPFVAYFSVVLVLTSFFCHFMHKTTSQEVFWKVLCVNSKNPVNIMTSCIIQF